MLEPADAGDYDDISSRMRDALTAAEEGIYRQSERGDVQRGDPWAEDP